MSHAARIARRTLLASASAAVLARALPAQALPRFHGGSPQPAIAAPLAVTLTFPDGNILSFNQSSATDLGDYVSPVGGFTQKNFRQRASGNGDYRDGFTVFFRPDAVGSRREVVVEFQTEWVFSPTAAPIRPNGGTIQNLFVPPVPVLSKTTGGTSAQSGTAFVCLSYVFPSGETVPSPNSSIAVAVGDLVVVPSPPPMAGAIAYRIYSNLTSNPVYLQAEVPIGTNWTEPATGIVTSGTREQFVSTATIYTAVISGGGLGAPVTIPVTTHWSQTRWRWYSAPRPVIRSYADLVAAKAILPLSTDYLYGALLPAAVTWAGPLDTGGIGVGWAGQGNRAEIGLTNDWVAAWLLTGATSAPLEASWRAAAEATGTCPWWWRDVATGRLFDMDSYPYMALSNAGAVKYTLPALAPKSTCLNYMVMDNSHTPDFSFVAWMLTDDPYFLEGVQATALYTISSLNLTPINEGLPWLFPKVQPRAWVWGARDVFRAAGFSPISAPSWLQARSYWAARLPNNLTFLNKYINSSTLQCAVFHSFPHTNEFEGFMEDYKAIVISWIKYTGLFPSWDSAIVWLQLYRETLSDTTDSSGWDHRLQTPYYLRLVDGRLGAGAITNGTGGDYATPSTADTVTSWGDAWTGFKAKAAADHVNFPAWTDPSTWGVDTLPPIGPFFMPGARAALAAIAISGSPTMPSKHAWYASHLLSDFSAGEFIANGANYKWAIAPS